MRFVYSEMPDWPRQAWLAICRHGDPQIDVFHGSDVESHEEWFGELAWPGKLDDADFDLHEIIAGSGARIRGGRLTFVSPSSTVDRLQHIRLQDRNLVSNSLPCVLRAASFRLPPAYPRYNRDISSIQYGLRKYKRTLNTSGGPVHLVYFNNLVWDSEKLEPQPKPADPFSLSSFHRYKQFLLDNLCRLAENATSAYRSKKKYTLLATASSGYDSTTVATLASQAGCREAICFEQGQGGIFDSGVDNVGRLGMKPVTIPRNAWLTKDCPEVPIIAGGVLTSVIFAGAQEQLAGRVLLTGYHGDMVWDLHNPKTGPDIVRGDCSGLGLTEYRLWAGFLHAPLAFWGVRRVEQIHAISQSAEMQPFIISGTNYNRPICRKIVEEAGIPRDAFGVTKRAADLHPWQESQFMTDTSIEDYFAWLRENPGEWLRRFRVPPLRSVRGDRWLNELNKNCISLLKSAARTAKRLPGAQSINVAPILKLNPKLINLRQYYFPWAVDRAIDHYSE